MLQYSYGRARHMEPGNVQQRALWKTMTHKKRSSVCEYGTKCLYSKLSLGYVCRFFPFSSRHSYKTFSSASCNLVELKLSVCVQRLSHALQRHIVFQGFCESSAHTKIFPECALKVFIYPKYHKIIKKCVSRP